MSRSLFTGSSCGAMSHVCSRPQASTCRGFIHNHRDEYHAYQSADTQRRQFKVSAARPDRVSRSRQAVVLRSSSEAIAIQQNSGDDSSSQGPVSDKSINKSPLWEIDFCSRPLLDERGKKVWELLICDPERNFEYAQYFPNSKINSTELKKAIEEIVARPGAERPEKARFFRSQMQTIMSRALSESGIKPIPSRRSFSVMSWLEERIEAVYKKDPRYSDKAQSLFSLDLSAPEPLPDALRGEQWAFVQLPLRSLLEMMGDVMESDVFGNAFDLKTVGIDDLPPDVLIPGVAVFSRRALPLAAWTSGLEIAAVKADVQRACLILETGVNQRWRYGSWRTDQDTIDEAENWEDCKQGVKGVHFLAVQPDPDSDQLSGLWLLLDRPPPQI